MGQGGSFKTKPKGLFIRKFTGKGGQQLLASKEVVVLKNTS
jgi:hypothetical protein